jgi:hypothetical protein
MQGIYTYIPETNSYTLVTACGAYNVIFIVKSVALLQ